MALFLPAHFGLFIFVPGRKENLEKLVAQMCDFLVCRDWAQSRLSWDLHGLSRVFVKGWEVPTLSRCSSSIISQCPTRSSNLGRSRSFQFSGTDAGCW